MPALLWWPASGGGRPLRVSLQTAEHALSDRSAWCL